MLSDKSQSQKDPYCTIPFMKHLRYGTALWLPEVRNRGEGDGYNYNIRGSFMVIGYLSILSVMVVMQVYTK